MEIKITLTHTGEEAKSPDTPEIVKLWDELASDENKLELLKEGISKTIKAFMVQLRIQPEFEVAKFSILTDPLAVETRGEDNELDQEDDQNT